MIDPKSHKESIEPPDEPPEDCEEGEGGDDSGPWVTVATFSQPQQAHLARLRLENEEIDCFLIDENLVATDWLLANAVGGVKVQVHGDDADKAREILGSRHVLSEPEEDATEEEVEPPVPCPECGSTDVQRTWFSRRLFFLGFLIGLPLPVPMKIWRCSRCHHEWKHQPGFPVSPTSDDCGVGD